jgi:hypothetical protein
LLAIVPVLFGLPPDSCPKVLAASKLNSWAPTYVDRTKRLWDNIILELSGGVMRLVSQPLFLAPQGFAQGK